ncbi:D-alanyl-D-alanine carboxypeptidase family protein [Clostridium sp. 'deep sea']|uniref:D-alanyl-D-alanine carboxypeptidase family protein n=1 Tax=Clostridium sp. 'deep sea' TaxID=2779445 RepID=UPI001896911E|nr:D-alanyl-D-alanine carboxypeptidase family protein [Clostridium sp. 'deep sea']QOR34044.1 D-alanyl-D-alanine carboxypeptidase family protein [Clostridium sp. 'deep sea']
MKKLVSMLVLLTFLVTFTGCDNATPIGGDKAELVSISASPNTINLYSGEKVAFSLTATMSDGETVDLASANNFSYKVSQDNVISIDSGYIKATNNIENANLTLTFTNEGKEAEITINITENPITAFNTTDDGDTVVKDAARLDVLVNKSIHLADTYKPADLVIPNIAFPSSYKGKLEKMHMRQDAATALEEMFKAAKEEGVELFGISGYRSYNLQKGIFKYQVGRHGGSEEEANKISAKPGQSEHQTGLAMDISCRASGYSLVESFEETEEGKWLKENCAKFGFVLRYVKGKEDITGYSYEPWHFRYVGKELAPKIMKDGLTLEEYFSSIN